MQRKILLAVVLIALLMMMSCAKRNTAWHEPDVLQLLHQVPIVGDPLDMSFDGNSLYVAQDQGGFSIIDLGNYSQKWYTVLSASDGSSVPLYKIRKISMVGEHARLFLNETDGTDLIRIVDTSDPDTLKVIDAITGATQDISDMVFKALPTPVAGNIIEATYCAGRNLYYGRYNGDLWLGSEYTVNPSASASGFDTDDTHIYIAAQQLGILIYNRANQQYLGQLALPGEAQKVKVRGNYAYVASRQGGFHVVDISNPAAPQKVYTYDTDGYATSVDLSGNYAVVSSGGGGIYLFDISSPSQPELKQHLTSCGYTNNAKLHNGKLIVAARDQGILVYDIAD